MNIDLSERERELIVIALNGFIDDNILYAEQISSRLSKKDKESFESLNTEAKLILIKLGEIMPPEIVVERKEEHDQQQKNVKKQTNVKKTTKRKTKD